MNELIKSLAWNKKMAVLRTIKGWTQHETADKCNTNQKVYWNWESGNVYPHKNNRIAIAKAFGVKESEIFKDLRRN